MRALVEKLGISFEGRLCLAIRVQQCDEQIIGLNIGKSTCFVYLPEPIFGEGKATPFLPADWIEKDALPVAQPGIRLTGLLPITGEIGYLRKGEPIEISKSGKSFVCVSLGFLENSVVSVKKRGGGL